MNEDKRDEQRSGAVTVDDVRQMMSQALGDLFASGRADVRDAAEAGAAPAGRRSTAKSSEPDIGAQVRSEVEKIRAADQAERERRGLADQVAALKEVVERPPREFNRLTSWMWGEPDE